MGEGLAHTIEPGAISVPIRYESSVNLVAPEPARESETTETTPDEPTLTEVTLLQKFAALAAPLAERLSSKLNEQNDTVANHARGLAKEISRRQAEQRVITEDDQAHLETLRHERDMLQFQIEELMRAHQAKEAMVTDFESRQNGQDEILISLEEELRVIEEGE
jgi:hypothetical protein